MHLDERILRLPEVITRTGLSRSTIYEYLTIGFFPHPITLGKRAVGWVDSEITAWIEQRINQSRNGKSQAHSTSEAAAR